MISYLALNALGLGRSITEERFIRLGQRNQLIHRQRLTALGKAVEDAEVDSSPDDGHVQMRFRLSAGRKRQ